jgi:hypothetical protein
VKKTRKWCDGYSISLEKNGMNGVDEQNLSC